MSLKKFDENFNSIIKSLKPLKEKFSVQSYMHDKYFRNYSLNSLKSNFVAPKKPPDNFFISNIDKKLDYIYNLSNNSYSYITDLNGIKNIPLKINKKGKNFVKNLYNPEFETKPEEQNDNKSNNLYDSKSTRRNKKVFKFEIFAADPGYYHPDYNKIKQRIPCIDFGKSQNSHEKFDISKIGEGNNIDIVNFMRKMNRSEEPERSISAGKYKKHIQKKESNENEESSGDESPKNKLVNIPKESDRIHQQSIILPSIQEKTIKKRNSPRKRSGLHKSYTQNTILTPIMIAFNKMSGRYKKRKKTEKDILDNKAIEYKPNYDITLPHIKSIIFKSKMNQQDYKKFLLGKMLRSYKCNSNHYVVMDINNKKK